MTQELIDNFIERLTIINGEVIRCTDDAHLAVELKEFLISRNGSITKTVHCSDRILQQFLQKNAISHSSPDLTQNKTEIGISRPEFLIARTGSVMFSSAQDQDNSKTINAYSHIHLVIACEDQIVAELDDTLIRMKQKYNHIPSPISIISGPSRTADAQKTLIIGAHGPKEFVVFLVKKNIFE